MLKLVFSGITTCFSIFVFYNFLFICSFRKNQYDFVSVNMILGTFDNLLNFCDKKTSLRTVLLCLYSFSVIIYVNVNFSAVAWSLVCTTTTVLYCCSKQILNGICSEIMFFLLMWNSILLLVTNRVSSMCIDHFPVL